MTVLYVSFLKLNPQIWTIIIMVSYTIFMTSFSKVFFFHTFFPLGPPPYPEGNSNSASNFPSFPQSIFFLFFPFKPLPYPEGNFNFALYFPFFSLRFFSLPFLHLNIFSTFREIPIKLPILPQSFFSTWTITLPCFTLSFLPSKLFFLFHLNLNPVFWEFNFCLFFSFRFFCFFAFEPSP